MPDSQRSVRHEGSARRRPAAGDVGTCSGPGSFEFNLLTSSGSSRPGAHHYKTSRRGLPFLEWQVVVIWLVFPSQGHPVAVLVVLSLLLVMCVVLVVDCSSGFAGGRPTTPLSSAHRRDGVPARERRGCRAVFTLGMTPARHSSPG